MASQPFLTSNMQDYQWPQPRTVCFVPAQPLMVTKPPNLYMTRPLEDNCKCESHNWNPMLERYRCLAEKEKRVVSDLCLLRKEMLNVTNEILENPCGDDDSKLKSIYQIDYTLKGFSPTDYQKLMADVDSPVGVPIPPLKIELGNGYRDPTSFRYLPTTRPTIDPCRPVNFTTTPYLISQSFNQYPGRSEYQDTISKTGLSIVMSSLQYQEPLPSSRRRFGDPNV